LPPGLRAAVVTKCTVPLCHYSENSNINRAEYRTPAQFSYFCCMPADSRSCLSNSYLIESEHAGIVAPSIQNSCNYHKAVAADNIIPVKIDRRRLLTPKRDVPDSRSNYWCASLLCISLAYLAGLSGIRYPILNIRPHLPQQRPEVLQVILSSIS